MAELSSRAPRLSRTAPYFLVDDVTATAEYYRDVLGFSFDRFFGIPPSFTIVRRDVVAIMLRQARPPVARPNRTAMDEAFDAYVWVDDVDALATELRANKADIVEGPVDRIYHMRELLVRDLNGCVLAFGQG
jgi:catechol 2,3-dioxygenase-like lactoylglutathione lyase family enzyme